MTGALSVRGASKTFPGQLALNGVDMDVRAGEVHALIGENGSGKSTLIKCLAGFHHFDTGAEVVVGGRALPDQHSPAAATDAGLVFVHQQLGLISAITVIENIALERGYATGAGRRIRWRHETRRARALLDRYGGEDIPADAPVRTLSQAQRTIVAIARALAQATAADATVLVLDEPTAALPEPEVQRLFEVVSRVRDAGMGVVFVSHRLEEIFAIADRVTVLRDGVKVGTFDIAGLDERELTRLIVGRSLSEYVPEHDAQHSGDVVLRSVALSGRRVREASFEVRRGEIVGVAGLLGSGRSELARMLFGAQIPETGTLELDGAEARLRTPQDAMRLGIALVPENRAQEGSFAEMSLAANITLIHLRRFFRGGLLRRRLERDAARELVARFDVRPADPDRQFLKLSGGNQQKAILAKWLESHPRVLVLDEPVQGVDVGARVQIYEMLAEAAAQGAAVIVISSEFEELARLCDRILATRRGRIVADVPGGEGAGTRITELAYSTGEHT